MKNLNLNFKKEDRLKFIFLGVMLFVAVLGRLDGSGMAERSALQEDIRGTSFTAEARPVLSQSAIPTRASRSVAALEIQARDSAPFQKRWDVPLPELSVKAALAKDLDHGTDFYRLNSDARWPLASLTKLMTAVVAVEEVGLEKVTVVSEAAVATEGVAGDLEKDEKYRVGELVKAMLVVSSNDAAAAIAEFYGQKNFLDQMQIKAADLGMNNTSFADPAGLAFLNQGTIEDLEKLVSYIDKNHPAIFKTSAQAKVSLYEEGNGIEKELLNINGYASSRPNFLGGKTGFTEEANGNLVSIFSHQGHRILIIVLGTDKRFEQTDLLYNWVVNSFEFN